MNAVVITEAIAPGKFEFGRPATIQVDGLKWLSEMPVSAGEAQSYNQDAHLIAERLNRKQR